MSTINTEQIVQMLASISEGIAAEFELDPTEVRTFLTNNCEDVTGVSLNEVEDTEDVTGVSLNEVEDTEDDAEEVEDTEDDAEEVEDTEDTEDDAEEVEDTEEEDTEAEIVLTVDQIRIWFMAPAKGGLKLDELKEQAQECGLEIAKKTTRQEIKDMMMEIAEDEEEDEEEEGFDVYMEAPGAKVNKFWKCTVDSTDMIVNYGSVGKNGQSSIKSFSSTDLAIAAANKLYTQKVSNGYSEEEEEEALPTPKKVAPKSAGGKKT